MKNGQHSTTTTLIGRREREEEGETGRGRREGYRAEMDREQGGI